MHQVSGAFSLAFMGSATVSSGDYSKNCNPGFCLGSL